MARETKTITVVHCAMLDQELPALEKKPFPGPLGERIFDEISAYAYQLWSERASLLINHYGLNMADPRSHEFLSQQMEEFFFGGGEGAPLGGAPSTKGTATK